MSKEVKEFLNHIAVECEYLLSINKKDITREVFINDATLKRAAVRSMEIIGEATKKISLDFKLKHNHIPWKYMAGMRDVLIHNYVDVNYQIVWDVIKNEIPTLHEQIMELINTYK
jgi:uncharacterized protein with HEPN domain